MLEKYTHLTKRDFNLSLFPRAMGLNPEGRAIRAANIARLVRRLDSPHLSTTLPKGRWDYSILPSIGE